MIVLSVTAADVMIGPEVGRGMKYPKTSIDEVDRCAVAVAVVDLDVARTGRVRDREVRDSRASLATQLTSEATGLRCR